MQHLERSEITDMVGRVVAHPVIAAIGNGQQHPLVLIAGPLHRQAGLLADNAGW
jgi:hypothetical protein